MAMVEKRTGFLAFGITMVATAVTSSCLRLLRVYEPVMTVPDLVPGLQLGHAVEVCQMHRQLVLADEPG